MASLATARTKCQGSTHVSDPQKYLRSGLTCLAKRSRTTWSGTRDWWFKLEDKLDAKLDLARASLGLVESGWQSCSIKVVGGVVLASGIEEAGGEKVGVVEDVEELGAELYVEGFGDGWYFCVFEEGHVEGVEAGTVEAVAPGVA